MYIRMCVLLICKHLAQAPVVWIISFVCLLLLLLPSTRYLTNRFVYAWLPNSRALTLKHTHIHIHSTHLTLSFVSIPIPILIPMHTTIAA